MGDGYRDPLSAAHARIAELEEKIASLEAEKQAGRRLPPTGQFPELEEEVRLLRAAIDPTRVAKRQQILVWFAMLFPVSSGILSYVHQPILSTVCSAIFFSLMALNIVRSRGVTGGRKRLVVAEEKLKDAERIWELETKLAENERRVRVGEGGSDVAETEPLSDEADESTQTAARS